MPVADLFITTLPDDAIADELARRLEALGRSRISPEDFHAVKSELVTGLRRLAGRMRAGGRRADRDVDRGLQRGTTWRPPYDV
jgi:hypothetical protein